MDNTRAVSAGSPGAPQPLKPSALPFGGGDSDPKPPFDSIVSTLKAYSPPRAILLINVITRAHGRVSKYPATPTIAHIHNSGRT